LFLRRLIDSSFSASVALRTALYKSEYYYYYFFYYFFQIFISSVSWSRTGFWSGPDLVSYFDWPITYS